jgi:hypothetical protein
VKNGTHAVKRDFTTFIGIDLGGARGKTTAVARIEVTDAERGQATVLEVCTRFRAHAGEEAPWHDDSLLDYVTGLAARAVVAIDAPLTAPACVRCQLGACPGISRCDVPATVWLRTVGAQLQDQAMSDLDRIAVIPSHSGFGRFAPHAQAPFKQRVAPYTHRCTEVWLHYDRDLIPRDGIGQGTGPVSARAAHLRRVMSSHGFRLNENLLEVSPRATVAALFGAREARGYKRDADPWETRAAIIENLSDSLKFAFTSRLSREEVLRNDHCFDALLSAYTAFLWARDGWTMPDDGAFADDGWIWVPPAGR